MHVCSHTDNGMPACAPCDIPMIYHKRESSDKFNKLVNNISSFVVGPAVKYGDEIVERFIRAYNV